MSSTDEEIPIDNSLLDKKAKVPEETKAAVKNLLLRLHPYVRSLTVAPNIHTASLLPSSASPATALRGYVARVDGSAPLARVTDHNFGRVTLAYPVVGTTTTDTKSPFHPVDETAVVQKFTGPVPMFDAHPGISTGLYRTREGLDTQYVVVAQGNDVARTKATLGEFAGSTVDQFYQSDAYAATLNASHERVASAAKHWAAAHGLRLAPEPTVNTHSFVFKHDKPASIDPVGSTDTAKNVYLYYNDVTDASRANGGVLLHAGALAGFLEVRGPRRVDAQGRPTHSWTNSAHSLFPQHTGLHQPETASFRRSAMHPSDSTRMAEAAKQRIKWDGPIVKFNHDAEAKFNGVDAATHDWMRKLGDDVHLETRSYDTVVCQPAGINPDGLSLAKLLDLSRGSDTVQVRHDEPALAAIVTRWNDVQPRLGDTYAPNDLHKVFARQTPDGKKLEIDRKVLEVANML